METAKVAETSKIDRQTLKYYLLGRLSEDEQKAVAERYITDVDNTIFEQLEEVEYDLIDRYVRNQLSTDESERLKRYLDRLPDGWQKVEMARALADVIDQGRLVAVAKKIQPAIGALANKAVWGGQKLLAWLSQPIPVLATVIGLTVVFCALILLILRYQQLSYENAQLRENDAQQTRSIGEVERKLTEEQNRSAQLQQELERERRRRETQSPIKLPAFHMPMVKWPLSSVRVRGSDQSSEALRLDPKAKTVALIIQDKGRRKYTGYKVELRTDDSGRILWKDNQPYTPPMRLGNDIVFYRLASEFTATSYKLTLTLISAQETTTRDYYFTVA